jgi:crotonobetainyl-CoA:carnitine CoA-transferase CaiB-like acyl-CoA transferase
MRLMGLPISFAGRRPPYRASPPTLGQHTAAVLGSREKE